jgi:hypothetical protein
MTSRTPREDRCACVEVVAEAELLIRESLAIRAKKESDDGRTFKTMSMLGEAAGDATAG